MPADLVQDTAQPPDRPLWLRIVVALAALIGLTTAALFFGVDHFVSLRFSSLHAERMARLRDETRQTVARELTLAAGIASLLVNDGDLVNSTYYHLHLEGGREHPQAAVDRIGAAFGMESVTLWAPGNQLVATAGHDLPLAFPQPELDQPVQAEARWLGGSVWVVAVATLVHNEDILARIQLARPLTTLFRSAVSPTADVAVRIAGDRPPAPGAARVSINPQADPPVALDVSAPDAVAAALSDVKAILALVMTAFAVILLAGIAVSLRRTFRPVLDLIRVAPAVGRGEFGRQVPVSGGSEVAALVKAFNDMSEGLRRLRELERQVQHQEQLSAIGRVAARVAHDLNNPLTVVSNLARLAVRRADIDPQLADDLRMVLHHSERSIAIVEALLAYGRPIRLMVQALDLGKTCTAIARRWQAGYPDADLQVAPAPTVPVSGDAFQVEQMLINLLDNARAMGRRIVLSVAAEGPRALIRVEDDGPGFSPEAREHLFEPFFTTRTGGTGLGLASCLAIARAHGGDIVVDCGPPGRVTVRLPLHDGA